MKLLKTTVSCQLSKFLTQNDWDGVCILSIKPNYQEEHVKKTFYILKVKPWKLAGA